MRSNACRNFISPQLLFTVASPDYPTETTATARTPHRGRGPSVSHAAARFRSPPPPRARPGDRRNAPPRPPLEVSSRGPQCNRQRPAQRAQIEDRLRGRLSSHSHRSPVGPKNSRGAAFAAHPHPPATACALQPLRSADRISPPPPPALPSPLQPPTTVYHMRPEKMTTHFWLGAK
jgi:hypothetical protein